MRFYFEQRFKSGISNVAKEIGEELTSFSEEDLQDLRNLSNEFDDTDWVWGEQKEDENLNRIKERNKQLENELLEFTYSADELRRTNQKKMHT